ncbi:MAG: hypothetical protein GY754_00665 [bacterium]|nr:hypothetical protein [bacterium]
MAFASSFIGFGTGSHFSKSYSSEDTSFNTFIPIVIEYEYTRDYRDLWMLHSSVSYVFGVNNSISNDLIITTVGIKYVPKFYYYTSNISQKSHEKLGCFSIIVLPITILRDAIINVCRGPRKFPTF